MEDLMAAVSQPCIKRRAYKKSKASLFQQKLLMKRSTDQIFIATIGLCIRSSENGATTILHEVCLKFYNMMSQHEQNANVLPRTYQTL